jgi:3-oxoadipate enol-lactonase
VTNWLLLHGTPLTPSVWDGVVPLLAGRGEVIAPPVVPGAGPAAGLHRALAEQLAADVMDSPSRWHVVGHSFGGQIALELAMQRPELVDSLTLLCTRDTPYPPFAAAAAGILGGTVDVDGALQRWFSPDELAVDGPVVRYARDTVATADHRAWSRALSAISVFDVSAAVGAIQCPVTVVAAGHDEVSDPSSMADVAARLPQSSLTVLKNAWHMSVFTDPDRLAALMTG